MTEGFLPVCAEDMRSRGWDQLDFLFITGDAYVDHPSFGHAIISRVLDSRGYRVGIVAQPDWHSIDDFVKMGRPRLGVLVTAGNIDSMVNHYTAAKKRRSEDLYSPGRCAGLRPDRATIVYCNRVREAFGDIPLLIGGVEASLRRFAHYDYWDNKVRRSILFDSRADILMYGMGEHQIAELAECLESGMAVGDISYIKGTCVISKTPDVYDSILLPSFEQCVEDKTAYAEAFRIEMEEQNPYIGKALVQEHAGRFLVQNPPSEPLSREELDEVYELGYMREPHPMYEKDGGIAAIEEVRFSITSSRGCFGSCSFCALAFHQGRIVTSRSRESIIKEAKMLTKHPKFKGYIHDVGGPTANFRAPACEKQLTQGACKKRRCLFPKPCPNLKADHREYTALLRDLRKIEGVKKVFVRSGIRFDYLMCDKNRNEFLRELCEISYKRAAEGRAGAYQRQCSAAYGQAGKQCLRALLRGILRYEREAREKAVSRSVSDVESPGQHAVRCGKACGIFKKARPEPRAGAGFLPDTRHGVDLYVLYRHRPDRRRAGLHGENPRGKGNAARAFAVGKTRESAACYGGA